MRWMLKCSGPPIQGRSILATKMLTPRTSPAKSEPYNKYKRQGAHEPSVFYCTMLDAHGVKPEKVLRHECHANLENILRKAQRHVTSPLSERLFFSSSSDLRTRSLAPT